MIDRAKARRTFPSPIPVGDLYKLPCSSCNARVDPMRAARVAVYGERFYYFCSPECRVRFVPGAAASSAPPPVSRAPRIGEGDGQSLREPAGASSATTADAGGWASAAPRASQVLFPRGRDSDKPEFETLDAEAPASAGAALDPAAASGAPLDAADLDAADLLRKAAPRSAWLGVALGLGVLAAILGNSLQGGFPLPRWTPALSAAAACLAFWLSGLERGDRVTPFARVPPLVATLAAVCASLFAVADAAQSARLAGVVSAVAAGSRLWIAHKQQVRHSMDRWLALALGDLPEAPRGMARSVASIKPGEELVLRAGDRVNVDVVITAGEAHVVPWPGSRLKLLRREGDGLLAGTRVSDGALRAVVRWVGHDRAWARLGTDPTRRADRHLGVARVAERLSTSGAAALGLLALLVSLALDTRPLLAMGHGAAVAAALGNVALAELIALLVAQGLHRLQQRGICCRSAAALDRAGRTSSVVFCARGTLLSGELSVASIEPAGSLGEAELLGLLAGAYAGVASPLASALQRTLAAQKLRPDATRSPNHLPGLGMTAVASNGQALVAGTRALLLERRISVASAEARIAELEALGRSVLLVALDGRWVGLVALQDGLRPGARAATQTLLDAGVEPVLLSGEARETCRALARHIGIEHVRPEVLPNDRAAEVRRLAQAGGMLAVVGSSIDDAALAAAPLSIDIDARGGPLERCDIDIASGDVRDAAAAIQLARNLHARTRAALLIATAPLALGLLLVFVGLPIWLLPVLGLSGSALAARQRDDAP